MTDFKKALEIGIEASLKVKKNNCEIKQLIIELNNQASEATTQKVAISIKKLPYKTDKPQAATPIPGQIPRPIPLRLTPPQLTEKEKFPQKYALIAYSTCDETQHEILSPWEQANEGYPCAITIGKNIFSCEDKKSLENSLIDLLKNATTGDKIRRLMEIPVTKPTPNS